MIQMPMMRTARTETTMMPTIAPVERPDLLLAEVVDILLSALEAEVSAAEEVKLPLLAIREEAEVVIAAADVMVEEPLAEELVADAELDEAEDEDALAEVDDADDAEEVFEAGVAVDEEVAVAAMV